MSLLLEALKKAELAKQSLRPGRAEAHPHVEPIITRESLPDITQPLEILPNDLPSAAADRAPQGGIQLEGRTGETGVSLTSVLSASPDAADRTAPPPRDPLRSKPLAEDNESPPPGMQQSQAAARQMFEAKEMDYNPRRPFYITIGVLILCGSGYGGYVWWQMQPRSLYNSAAAKSPPKGNVEPAVADARPPAQVQPPTADAVPATVAPAPVAPGAPSAPASAAPAQAGSVAPPSPAANSAPVTKPQAPVADRPPAPGVQPAAKAPLATPSAAQAGTPPAPRRATPAEGSPRAARPSISIAPQAASVDPQVEQGYAAFQRGDIDTAREHYQRALRQDGSNRDALLGLAAIDLRTRNFELAESRYIRLLEADPRDSYAMAGLIALRGHIDPVQSESRLKTLIAAQPEAAQLHFALGNQFAAQKRWPEAQASYFRAFTLEPESPDFAFNLAISLDQMQQVRPALDYYRRALALSATRATSFDRATAANRIAELARQ